MIERKFFLVLCLVLMGSAIFYSGFRLGETKSKKDEEKSVYQRVMDDLGIDILVMDALRAGDHATVVLSISSRIEGNLKHMVNLFLMNEWHDSEYARCVVTRKLRQLREQGLILESTSALEELGYPLERVFRYLDAECPGPPSHDDWSDLRSD